jgi:hypothetical protein
MFLVRRQPGHAVAHENPDAPRTRPATAGETNKTLKAWGEVLHDDDLAQAIIDRVLEHRRLFRLDGPSIRTLHANVDGGGSGQNFRKKGAEFPGSHNIYFAKAGLRSRHGNSFRVATLGWTSTRRCVGESCTTSSPDRGNPHMFNKQNEAHHPSQIAGRHAQASLPLW